MHFQNVTTQWKSPWEHVNNFSFLFFFLFLNIDQTLIFSVGLFSIRSVALFGVIVIDAVSTPLLA
jgi:hypothetical protein